jgi:hypothetical protein
MSPSTISSKRERGVRGMGSRVEGGSGDRVRGWGVGGGGLDQVILSNKILNKELACPEESNFLRLYRRSLFLYKFPFILTR